MPPLPDVPPPDAKVSSWLRRAAIALILILAAYIAGRFELHRHIYDYFNLQS